MLILYYFFFFFFTVSLHIYDFTFWTTIANLINSICACALLKQKKNNKSLLENHRRSVKLEKKILLFGCNIELVSNSLFDFSKTRDLFAELINVQSGHYMQIFKIHMDTRTGIIIIYILIMLCTHTGTLEHVLYFNKSYCTNYNFLEIFFCVYFLVNYCRL